MTQGHGRVETMRIGVRPSERGGRAFPLSASTTAPCAHDATPLAEESAAGRCDSPEYRKLLQSVYDAVVITDPEGRIVDLNQRALDFFMCESDELVGVRFTDLISGVDETLMEQIRRNLDGHRYTLIEAHCVRRDNSTFPSEIAVNRIALNDRSQFCFFVRDITVRKRDQDALSHAVERLEAQDRAREQFVSNVSHELRTPLTSMIYAVTNMLKGVAGPLTASVTRYLQILDGDCRRLLGTVMDILDLSQIETRSLKLVKTRAPIDRLVERGVRSLRVQAESRCVSLSSVPDPAHRFVVCDVQKMERVLVNVIGNAVKFTPHGGSVTVDVAEDAEQPGFALIRVRDTGIGIPKDALGRVTERYFTVGEQPSGAGLGLAITKELVELHGGHLKIESPPPGHSAGTLVSIGLRQVPSLRVAVLDPDRKSRARLAEILSAKGYAVTEIGDPAAMGEAVAAAAPAVAVVKLGLEMGGEADWVASRGAGASANRPPVVCVSEAALGPDDVKRLRRGAARIVSAPYQPSDVLDAVENVCPAESDPQSR